jgi:hypothetical protein
VLGLAFVVFGSAILVAHNARVDRARLEAKLDEMSAALERSATAAQEAAVTYQPEPRASRAAPAKKTAARKTATPSTRR